MILFKSIGAPVVALAELSLTVEAIVMLIILSRRMQEPIKIDGSLLKGLVAALFGGGAAYVIAVMLPGGAVITAILGMMVGTIIALVIANKEVRLFLKLGKDENSESSNTVEYNNPHV